MLDHVSVGVADLERAARFYEAVLAPLGLIKLIVRPATIGFGKGYPEFWINLRPNMTRVSPDSGTHICLRARTINEVETFYAAALGAGSQEDTVFLGQQNWTASVNTTSDHPHSFWIGNFSGKRLIPIISRLQITPLPRTLLSLLDL